MFDAQDKIYVDGHITCLERIESLQGGVLSALLLLNSMDHSESETSCIHIRDSNLGSSTCELATLTIEPLE